MECRVGYTIDLQFTLNQEDYFFDTLEAVSTTDETQSRADYVEITFNEKASDQSKGIYKYTVKLLKYADDILIRPKCVVLPCITNYTPKTKESQYLNTPILVYFNMPVEDESVSQDDSLFNYSNISFKYTDESGKEKDMTPYFYQPEFNSKKTILTFSPKATMIKAYMNGEEDNGETDGQEKLRFIDINISFSPDIIISNQNIQLSLKQDSNSSFVVRYNTETEEVPPEKSGDSFYVTREEITFSDAPGLASEYRLTSGPYYNALNGKYRKGNLVSSTFYIYGKYYDNDSGVRSVEVSEKGQYNMAGNLWVNVTVRTRVYDAESNCITFENNGDGYTSFIIKYDMQEASLPSPRGGFFEIGVTVKDACGNTSKQETVWVTYAEYGFLDTCISKYDKEKNKYVSTYDSTFSVYNIPFTKSKEHTDRYDFNHYYSDIKTIRIMDDYKPVRYYIGGYAADGEPEDAYYITGEQVDYFCEYIDKNGVLQTVPFTKFTQPGKERTVVLDVDKVSDVSFTVRAKYNGIIIGRANFSFPTALTLQEISTNQITAIVSGAMKQGGIILYEGESPDDKSYDLFRVPGENTNVNTIELNNLTSGKLYFGNIVSIDSPYVTDKDYTYDPLTDTYTSYDTNSKLYKNDEFSYENKHFGNVLFGDLYGPFYNNQTEQTIPDEPECSLCDIQFSETSGYYDVILNFPNNLWTEYDSLSIQPWYYTSTDPSVGTPAAVITITKNDFDVDESGNNVKVIIPIKNTYFYYSNGTFRSPVLRITGKKGLLVSNEKQMSISLTEQQQYDLDNINPDQLYVKKLTDDRKVVLSFYDKGSGPGSGKIWLNNAVTPKDMTDEGTVQYAFPLSQLNYGINIFTYEVKDKKGNVTTGTLTYDTSVLHISHKCCISVYNPGISNKITFRNDSLKEIYENSDNNSLNLYKFNNTSNSWETLKEITKDDINKSESGTSYTYTLKSGSTVYIPSENFIRVCFKSNSKSDDDTILYTKSYTGDGKENFILANGSSKNSVVIYSDKVVFARVCYTLKSYDVCKNWNTDQWELLVNAIWQEEEVPIPSGKDHVVYNFNAPYSRSCYCVVVHYADGTTGMSQIFGNY